MKQTIYFYEGSHQDPLFLTKAINDFTKKEKIDTPWRIYRKESKKIAIEDDLFYISKSNTPQHSYLICSKIPCSLDMQEMHDVKILKIAEKFFLEEEIHYIKQNPSKHFYTVWCLKEAYIKYFEGKMEEMMHTFSVMPLIHQTAKDFYAFTDQYQTDLHRAIIAPYPFTVSKQTLQ